MLRLIKCLGYYSKKSTSSEFDQNENEWQHEKIELIPDNKDYPILTIEADEAEDFIVIAEFLQVIST